MSVAVLARAPARRLRPGVRRGLMAGASLLMHVVVLGSMILLAASEDRPVLVPDLQPIIQLEIEPRLLPPEQLPVPRPTPPLPVPTPDPLPLPTPTAEATPQTVAVPVPVPAPISSPQPKPQVAPAPTPAPAPKPLPLAPAIPAPAPARVPAPVPAPVTAPPAAAERAAPAPAPVIALRLRKKDEDEARDGLPAAPAPRLATPAPGAPSAAASAAASGVDGVSDAWRVAPEGQGGRNARALRTSPAGCPSTRVLRPGEQAICDDRFNARAAEGATRPITGTGNAERDARFAREGAREMQRFEAQRRPLSGGVGVLPPQECPGSNFGTGCAGAHLDPSMRQGATTNVKQDSNKLPDPR